jgi:hypothetical protein
VLVKQEFFSCASPVHFALVILEMGNLTNYLAGLPLNHDPPDLSFLSS